jgi:ferritin-like metal-binding protein YciE
MEQMNDLRELLKHDVQMLHSAEEQIIAAMPAMVAAASNPRLKQALEEHLRVTQTQLERLNTVRQMLGANEDSVDDHAGLLSRLMGKSTKCHAMAGVITEGQKVIAEDMSAEVRDAAIIGGNQKIEHLEIASYGTARTYAEQLGLTEVAQLLQQTLDEEYTADEMLTTLAVSSVNQRAETGVGA